MTSPTFPPTDRTTIGRLPERGRDDRATAYAILDEALVAHVGLAEDHGPVVIPTTYARVGDDLIIHGSPAASWLRAIAKGAPVCVTVTLLDGLVAARSGFHHSMNYRAVVVFGVAEVVTDDDAKRAALEAVVDHVLPGRNDEVRPMTEREVRSTIVVRLALEEASVKARTGGPKDEPEDYGVPGVWAGVVPVMTTFGPPVPDEPPGPDADTPRSVLTRTNGRTPDI